MCARLQTEACAAVLSEKLSSWGELVTGAAGHFWVAALQPRALNIQNVPPTVLIRENQMALKSLVRHCESVYASGRCG